MQLLYSYTIIFIINDADNPQYPWNMTHGFAMAGLIMCYSSSYVNEMIVLNIETFSNTYGIGRPPR